MESPRPMDRLVCGDVGYGKTEVAMRAAFKAVCDNRQAAILAPTTVLALQHSNTFGQRFQGFPVRVAMVSRFRSRKEQAAILKDVQAGLVDILIGTHRLLSKDVKFRRLGLIIIDEEQRFGVAQKERLKKLKTKVDVLTLSATPIPRTLNMSLIGLRDLSIIETPPKDRLAIQTVVVKFNRHIIRSAIDLELKRSGQVFFLHNKVETIHSIARMVQDIAPEARVAFAHGQMREQALEEVMIDFLNYKYDVLVSTTIIENGLDIPRANTLIVNQADRFGLSQLYQLRGRVGRSNRRAYCYLLISSEETLSSDAQRRLKAIREFSDLGAGFRIAALDLEIRGAGNLLGGEQHGQINAVGFELYTKLLEQAIRELKGEEVEEEFHTSVELRMDIQIPEHYIEDSTSRLWLYKRISSASDEAALSNLREEIVDRHGKFPRSVSHLFEYARLRLKAGALKILSIDRKGSGLLFKFRQDTPIAPGQIIELVQCNPRMSLSPQGVLSLHSESTRPSEVFQVLHDLLDGFATQASA
ncbi:MAG: TRCF domain-containing protein, partial [Acidobacteriota bacterium]